MSRIKLRAVTSFSVLFGSLFFFASVGSAQVTPAYGNGILDVEGEACDDGNLTTGDGCNEVGEVEAGFTCDESEPSSCEELPPPEPEQVCGDDIIQSPEQCDDGNNVDGDGCDAACEVEVLTMITDEQLQQIVLSSWSTGSVIWRSVFPAAVIACIGIALMWNFLEKLYEIVRRSKKRENEE